MPEFDTHSDESTNVKNDRSYKNVVDNRRSFTSKLTTRSTSTQPITNNRTISPGNDRQLNMHTVGIVGINGNLGRPTTQLLVKAAEQDKIHLIVFHREGKAGDFKSGKNVELRVIDLDGPTQKIEEAVKGVNIFV